MLMCRAEGESFFEIEKLGNCKEKIFTTEFTESTEVN